MRITTALGGLAFAVVAFVADAGAERDIIDYECEQLHKAGEGLSCRLPPKGGRLLIVTRVDYPDQKRVRYLYSKVTMTFLSLGGKHATHRRMINGKLQEQNCSRPKGQRDYLWCYEWSDPDPDFAEMYSAEWRALEPY